MAKYILRKAEPKDVSDILRLIKVTVSSFAMYKALGMYMGGRGGYTVVGFAMYYFTYDPWIGKLLYLEDFYVMKEYRGYGIGSEIFKKLSHTAVKTRCSGMHFIVAEWNTPSIEFYKRRGASDLSSQEGWRLFEIDKEFLVKMSKE
ncbi:SAT1 acetyltransferase, partial [Polypterus senegalus]